MTTSGGDSEAFATTNDSLATIINITPSTEELLSMLMSEEQIQVLDTEEKKFAVLALILSRDPIIKSWSADKLFQAKIENFIFTDASDRTRTLKIEVVPHGIGKRFYINVYACDNYGRSRIFLKTIRYEDGSYRKSAYSHFYCPIWMKVVGNTSYLSGNAIDMSTTYGITSDDLEFDFENLKIERLSSQTQSTEDILSNLLQTNFLTDNSDASEPFQWALDNSIEDAIEKMDVKDRDAYFDGKIYATQSQAEIDSLRIEERRKFEFYKNVYADLMIFAATSSLTLEHQMLTYEICIRSGIGSIPHQVIELLTGDIETEKSETVVSHLMQMSIEEIEFARDQKFGPPLREHLEKVARIFLNDSQAKDIISSFDSLIGLLDADRWMLSELNDQPLAILQDELGKLINKYSTTEEYVETLSAALLNPYFRIHIQSKPSEALNVIRLLMEGMGEQDYIRFARPFLETQTSGESS